MAAAILLVFMGRITRQVAVFAIVAVIVVLPMAEDQASAEEVAAGGLVWDLETGLSKTAEGYPNVAGDDWKGVYYRTDSSSRTDITATITHNGSGGITVRTFPLSGRGRYLTGLINSGYSGRVDVFDDYDNEEWTTHTLEESYCAYFGIEDYVRPPTYSDPDPPLYRIELNRDPPPPPPPDVSWLPAVLQLLLLD